MIFVFIILSLGSFAQSEMIDSVRKVLLNAKTDTARIGAYVQLTFAADDDKAVSYCDTAQKLISVLMPAADGKMKNALNEYLSDALYFKSMYFSNAESYDTAIHVLNEALKPALAAKNKKQEARILNDLGVCYYHKNDVVATIDYFKRSLAIREVLNDEEQLRNAYNNMAFIYKETGLINNSLELNFKALSLAEKRNKEDEIANSLNNIGQVYHKFLLDYKKALEYYNKALALREKMDDKKGTGLLKNNIAALYSDMGNYTEAIRWYNESLALRRSINFRYGIINTLSNLGNNYTKVKEYEKAGNALAESLELNKSLQDNTLQASIHGNYAALYKDLGNTDSAIYHALLAHNINLEFGNPLNISNTAQLISGLYEKSGNYKKSLEFYKLYKTMKDSILNDDLKKQGIKSELEYQYLKKKTETDKIYNEQLARRNFYTWLFVILFIASGVISYILYKRYKLKQQLKQVEIRSKIASDLHDDVGSTLSSIRMYSDIVRQQPNQTETSAQLLNKISSNSKEMIENMSDIVW
ncbi:MAG TPA: tetratricopeptide repeat protein, partial [Chitinophagaceae bacterium]|nr:tetratricopeptide repeat protein [Chitinophagaceae bacterium]